MNKLILMGRLTGEPEMKTFPGENANIVANFSLAVDRMGKQREGQPSADFFRCQAWGKQAEFAQKYLHKGTKILLDGRIQFRRYENKNGVKMTTHDVIVNAMEFAESKAASQGQGQVAPQAQKPAVDTSWMNVPETVGEEELPF